ncbi:hypothetical protein DYB28_014579 [Aphanomyces astaci]|uniref:Uncharacterized protein n=1 Tax=Aphanomyces astaci TaxID=112090 RepID=A0A9X8DQX5_APHAT|nr:hypothetical protein DYB28_014579 [Aphanomyces astaci]
MSLKMAPGRRDLTNDEREAILRETLLKSNGSYASRLPKGFGPYLASKYQCNVSKLSEDPPGYSVQQRVKRVVRLQAR